MFTDIDVEKPDEKSVMTYVAKFLELGPGKESATKIVESTPIECLEAWLCRSESRLDVVDNVTTDIHLEYKVCCPWLERHLMFYGVCVCVYFNK